MRDRHATGTHCQAVRLLRRARQHAVQGSHQVTRPAQHGLDDARVALKRLVRALTGDVYFRYRYRSRDQASTSASVALAEFALAARGFDFLGKKGEHAPKFRKELADAISLSLRSPLDLRLSASAKNARITAEPIIQIMNRPEDWRGNDVLEAKVPTPDGSHVRIIEATPEQVITSLEFVRHWLVDREKQRPFANDVLARLHAEPVTALEYAEAMYIPDGLEFMSAKLVALHAGIMHSMPIYRLYPATSEHEAIELWWPWGRPPPLIDGGPAKPPTPRKQVLDPRTITSTRPEDVVREVIERTGINRTTAQRMTAELRTDMRTKRRQLARSMLRKGLTRAEVARAVRLSPSRISAMFKGQTFPTRKALANAEKHDVYPENDDCDDC